MNAPMQMFLERSLAAEVRLPDSPPLTLTRNFAWVLAICVGSLAVVPLGYGWIASWILT